MASVGADQRSISITGSGQFGSADSSGGCTNTLVGGIGPHHTPSGRDCPMDQSLYLSFSSPACAGDCPSSYQEVCGDNTAKVIESLELIGQRENILPGGVSRSLDNVVDGTEPKVYSGVDSVDKFDPLDLGTLYFHENEVVSSYSSDSTEMTSDMSESHATSNAGLVRLESYSPPCPIGTCSGRHELGGVPIQLNPCSFYSECFDNVVGQDSNADYIFQGIRDGFKIVDDDFEGTYFCQNYDSILDK